ncbi:hypothetical protein NSPZN2_80032 [Nitrospira defluvii]|uniref:Uncharacterized protein n=1 Tax=Nitrospira defluvii TaxID=330214 RepID=A0ABM8SBZ8_9BACT|nr:hypothetical protein NSPZN2_80032 [Nitrospira defluvii]
MNFRTIRSVLSRTVVRNNSQIHALHSGDGAARLQDDAAQGSAPFMLL